jgi:hypothetical protein
MNWPLAAQCSPYQNSWDFVAMAGIVFGGFLLFMGFLVWLAFRE